MSRNIDASKHAVSVVIPAYRAGKHVAAVLRGIPSLVKWIVVVDDCSPDDTVSVVREEAQRDPRIHLLRHETNQGVGGATLTGYREAVRLGASIIVKMDSDGQMDPRYLPVIVAPILRGKADYAKGNRYVHSRELLRMPLVRRIGNLGLSFLTKLASGYWSVFDPTNGYTAIHASVLSICDESAISRRYFFESSMLLELSLARAVVKDVYIPARYGDETSHVSVIKTLLKFPASLLKGFVRRVWMQYFVRDFSIASFYAVTGAVLVFGGGTFGAYHWLNSVQNQMLTPSGTVMLAVVPIILGAQFLLQAVGFDIHNQPTQCLHRQLTAVLRDNAEANSIITQEDDTAAISRELLPLRKQHAA
jgi:glycosyltransferase involved in cell wall biosynthesis